MRRNGFALLAAFIAALLGAPSALAADVADVGFVDQQALSSVRAFADASRSLASYKASLDRQFAARMKGTRSAADQQRVAQEFSGKLQDRQRALFGPLFSKAQVAIASIASSKNLSVVVDKRIVIFGGQDITKNVIDLLSGVGDPVPPVNTPPPSSVGYVDQQQIDSIPKLKNANDEIVKFRNEQQAQAQNKLKAAKTDADRQAILKEYQKAVSDRQDQVLKPLVEQTRGVIANVAKKRHLVLVIDKGNLIYGGTDITADVQNALK